MNKLLRTSGNYVVYLRKSRADLEAEQHGEGETLARHRKILTDLARKLGIPISAYYEEIVSGDSISCRPVMQHLLDEVDASLWDGVIVMEVERLARGDTKDQGIVAESFKYSSTLIITPAKIYDPNNEFDEEYFEFGLFMSRREYKTIRRRLVGGKTAAIHEGKWPYNKAPYGYRIVKLKNEKGYTIEPVPEEAAHVHMIFDLYLEGNGYTKIARKLNDLGLQHNGKKWSPSTIPFILTNPAYIGKVKEGYRKTAKKIENGNITLSRPVNKDCLLYDGIHEPIISEDVFRKAQERKALNTNCPLPGQMPMTNPLSGLVICSRCRKKMVRRPCDNIRNPVVMLLCSTLDCKTVSSPLSLVESAILNFIRDYVEKHEFDVIEDNEKNNIDIYTQQIEALSAEKEKLNLQLTKQYDFLEQGIYDTETFLLRSNDVKNKITECNKKSNNVTILLNKEKARLEQMNSFLPKMERLLQVYDASDTADKNKMLKEVISSVEYTKDQRNRRGKGMEASFSLRIYPRVKGF